MAGGEGKTLASVALAAESAYRRAIALHPRCAEAWFNLGCLLADTGRTTEADACMATATRVDPQLANQVKSRQGSAGATERSSAALR
jgi:Flp pilus assembly protein TadD